MYTVYDVLQQLNHHQPVGCFCLFKYNPSQHSPPAAGQIIGSTSIDPSSLSTRTCQWRTMLSELSRAASARYNSCVFSATSTDRCLPVTGHRVGPQPA